MGALNYLIPLPILPQFSQNLLAFVSLWRNWSPKHLVIVGGVWVTCCSHNAFTALVAQAERSKNDLAQQESDLSNMPPNGIPTSLTTTVLHVPAGETDMPSCFGALDPSLQASDSITSEIGPTTPSPLPAHADQLETLVSIASLLPSMDSEVDEDDEGDLSDDSDSGTPASSKYPRPTLKNPMYGLVEGVKRGNNQYGIPRSRPLPVTHTIASKSTQRFNRVMKDLIVRCERLAAETGCWLYISGQHVNAAMGFYNYASPRMRREARTQVLEAHNLFQATYTALLNARRQEAVNLILEAEKYKEELRKAQAEIATKEARIAHLQLELLLIQSTSTQAK